MILWNVQFKHVQVNKRVESYKINYYINLSQGKGGTKGSRPV